MFSVNLARICISNRRHLTCYKLLMISYFPGNLFTDICSPDNLCQNILKVNVFIIFQNIMNTHDQEKVL